MGEMRSEKRTQRRAMRERQMGAVVTTVEDAARTVLSP